MMLNTHFLASSSMQAHLVKPLSSSTQTQQPSSPSPTKVIPNSCPISSSELIKELESLHLSLLTHLKQGSNRSPTKTTPNNNNNSYTTPTKKNVKMNHLFEDDCVSSPRHSSSLSFGDHYNNSSPSYSVSYSQSSTVFSNSPILTPPSQSETFENRLARLERLITQILSLIYKGEYKPKVIPCINNSSILSPRSGSTNSNQSSLATSTQLQESSEETDTKKLLETKIKRAHSLDMEPLKEMIASVVQYEPKRCTMGYEIVFEMKRELSFLSL